MPRDFLRFLQLPNSATPSAITSYVRDSAAFAGGVDPRFRAAVREAMIERLLPLDLSYAARMLAPGWRGLLQTVDGFFGVSDAHGLLFRLLSTGARSIRDYCGLSFGFMTEMWLEANEIVSAALADEPFTSVYVLPTPVSIPAALFSAVTDASLAEDEVYHACLTPFDYWPWVLDAEAIFPKLHTSIFTMDDMGAWPGVPELFYNPSPSSTDTLGDNVSRLGSFTLTGDYKDYPIPGTAGEYEISGKHNYAAIAADILGEDPAIVPVGGDFGQQFIAKTYLLWNTYWAPNPDSTNIYGGTPGNVERAIRAVHGGYRLTPRDVIESNGLISSIKLGVASYVRFNPGTVGGVNRSVFTRRKFDLVEMTHTGGAWVAPVQRVGPVPFIATLGSLFTPMSQLMESEGETVSDIAYFYEHREYPVCMIVEWNFKAFPEGYAPL